MENIMVDLETLGARPGCAILSIGAVSFDNRMLGETFYAVVARNDQRIYGLEEDPNTLEWWSKQSEESKKIVDQAMSGEAWTLRATLEAFNQYVERHIVMNGGRDIFIWGNGSDFDNAILAVCYAKVNLKMPWPFWNNRCYRTLKSLRPGVKMIRGGVHHNALDDAKSQAAHAVALMQALV